MVILSGLKQEIFQVVLTHQNTLSYTFSDQIYPPPPPKAKITTKKVKKTVFLDKFQTVPSFLPTPPILGLSFKFYYVPYPVTVLKLDEAKFRFQNLRLSKVIKEKPKGGRLPFGIRRVKKH